MPHRRAAVQGGRRTAEEEQEALRQHFASIQHIPEQKTLPTLLPSLQAALLRAVDTSPLKDELRRGRCQICSFQSLRGAAAPGSDPWWLDLH